MYVWVNALYGMDLCPVANTYMHAPIEMLGIEFTICMDKKMCMVFKYWM